MSTQHLQEKWAPVLGHQDLPEIKDSYRAAVTAQLLENQERCHEGAACSGRWWWSPERGTYQRCTDGGFTNAAAAAGSTAGFDPVMIGLIRRAMPNLMAYDICGVQPMSGPTGLIFAMRALYDGPDGNEALFDEANPTFSAGLGASGGTDTLAAQNPGLLNSATQAGYDPSISQDGSTNGLDGSLHWRTGICWRIRWYRFPPDGPSASRRLSSKHAVAL